MMHKFTALCLLIAILFSVVSAHPTSHNHGHEHSHALSNGQSCSQSIQCESQYCRRGICDAKKPNGHQCYKDSGCSSGKCDHKKCRGGGHPTIRPVPISTPCATATPSSSIPSVIVSPSPKPDTTTSTSIGTTISTITITATTSSTTASTSTSTTTSTTTSSSTSPPASTYTPAYGSLSYVARRADGQSPEIVTTSFFDKDYDGTLHSASVSLSAFALTEESYLMDFSHSVLVWRSGTAVMRPKDQETKEANGYPYVCSRGETTDQTPHGYPATNLICAASTGTHTYSDFFICASGKLVPGLNACDAGDDPSALLEVVQLPFSH